MGEMVKTSEEYCKSCKYVAYDYCNYLVVTHKRRNCKLGYCDKYEEVKPEERRKLLNKRIFK